ncbi:MAG: hypothetical protein COW39_15695 [Comamonadaceae bacterium CG17_big_fil_post_rev_8_21_14_2_50_60_13]|nr:MAG: hypothetical protein COW39_15695 [Comamonadaceae bacterium CG17_big_fil_post_rev_8_21_14_2_50_60_13]
MSTKPRPGNLVGFRERCWYSDGSCSSAALAGGAAAIVKQLEADGWYLARVKGSHHQFKHPDGDIPTPTLYSIQRQAGWRK